MYHQDLLGLFHPQGKEKHQQKGCLCRFLSSKKHLSSEINIASSAVESSNEIFASTSGVNETNKPDISVESNMEMDQGKKVEDLEARLLQSEKELAILRKKNEHWAK